MSWLPSALPQRLDKFSLAPPARQAPALGQCLELSHGPVLVVARAEVLLRHNLNCGFGRGFLCWSFLCGEFTQPCLDGLGIGSHASSLPHGEVAVQLQPQSRRFL